MSKVTIKDMISKGKIKIIDLPAKIEEIKENQALLLKDDVDDAKILLEQHKFRGAFIHAFNALERAIDMFLAHNKYKISDRFSRKIAIGKLMGKEFLAEYEDLFDLRKEGMYDRYGAIHEPDVGRLLKELIPTVLKKADVKI